MHIFSVSDGPSEIEKYYPAAVSDDGSITWNAPLIIKSSCLLDIRYFPWDQQACLLTFGSWTYTGANVGILLLVILDLHLLLPVSSCFRGGLLLPSLVCLNPLCPTIPL